MILMNWLSNMKIKGKIKNYKSEQQIELKATHRLVSKTTKKKGKMTSEFKNDNKRKKRQKLKKSPSDLENRHRSQ